MELSHIAVIIGNCMVVGGAILAISGMPPMVAGKKHEARPTDARRQGLGLAGLFGGAALITFPMQSFPAAFVYLLGFVFLCWTLWRQIQLSPEKQRQSLEIAVLWTLWMLALVAQFAIDVNTRVSIDRWSGGDWGHGGLLLLAVLGTGAGCQHIIEIIRRRKRAPEPA